MNTLKPFVEAKHTPKCPRHKGTPLKPEKHPISQEGVTWYWRCPIDQLVYMPDDTGNPR
jgi:hypothetical protein